MIWAHFFVREARTKNRAFRSKSSELPMQFLWAFRCNPSRKRQLKTKPITRRSQFCWGKIA
jgi:hypothetical protein